jgi:hypothetical protein
MPPHKSGFFIVGRYVKSRCNGWQDVYIVDEKRRDCLQETEQNGKKLVLHLDNAYYKPYEVKASEILKSGSLPAVLLPKSLDLMI